MMGFLGWASWMSLPDIIRRERAECVFVASSAVSTKDMVDISRACRQAEVEMRVSANLPDILTSRLSIQPIEESRGPVPQNRWRFTRTQATLKRCFDLTLAPAALLVSDASYCGDRGGHQIDVRPAPSSSGRQG
jgi:hypothetical protein